MKEDGRSARGGGRCDYKGLTIAGNGAVRVQGDAFCGSARRTGSASGVDCHGVAAAVVVDIVAAVCRRVAAEGRREEVEGVGASAVINVDASPLEREEREERGGSGGGGVS